jgi:hypothetical protein
MAGLRGVFGSIAWANEEEGEPMYWSNRGLAARARFHGDALALAFCAFFVAAPALAHHSYSMFDGSKKLTLQGTVKEVQWTNPHCFIQLVVSKNGSTQEWSLQMNAPVDLYRTGWRPRTLKAGEKITVVIHPARDGRNNGAYVSGTRSDGQELPRG